MSKQESQPDVQFLARFSDAWNRHDIDALMDFMADECEFHAVAGPDLMGRSFVGREAVREGFQLAWQGTAPHYVPLLAAMLVGVLLGYRLEGRWLDSHAQVATWRRLLAAALGAGAFVLLQVALKALAELWPLQDWLWQVVRGLIMGLFVAALMPWVLVRLRLLGARAPRRLASEVLE